MNFNQDDNSSVIKFTPRKGDTFSSNSEMGTRPTGDPKSSKNFQKLLSSTDKDKDAVDDAAAQDISEEESQGAAILSSMEQAIKKKTASSLFELSSRGSSHIHSAPMAKTTKKADPFMASPGKVATSDKSDTTKADSVRPDEQVSEAPHPESPSDVFAKISSKDTKKIVRDDRLADQVSLQDTPVKTPDKKEKFTSRFSTEQSDLSYVNPLALNTQPTQDITLKTEKAVLPAANVQAIIDQLVEKVTEMKGHGRTDTTVTLKHPPMFAGADLVVTAFDSAKGEFNITFQNLTQAAKELLDMRANQQSMLLALEQKGYAVHIVTTTTLVENRLPIATSAEQERQRNPDQQRQQQQQRERNT